MTVIYHDRLAQGEISIRRNFPWKHLLLISPLLILLLFTLIIPMGMLVWRTVAEPELVQALPNTQKLLKQWSGVGTPPDTVWDSAAKEISESTVQDMAGLGRRLTYDTAGMRPLLLKTRLQLLAHPEFLNKQGMLTISPRWNEPEVWQTLRRATGPVSSYYLLSALDLRYDYQHGIVDRPEDGLYRSILQRTFSIALLTTLLCMLLAMPLCINISRLTPRSQRRIIALIMLPFWTSILVRTTAWMVLLQDKGVINDFMVSAGLTDSPLHMLYNRFGVMVALVHVMLPFMVFPVLTSLSNVDNRLIRAAESLGARKFTIFWRVWLPQIIPGLIAGMLMVFIVTLGFYITPALIGGPGDQMISYYIALFTSGTMNWGLASALGIILTIITSALYLMQRYYTERNGLGG